MLGCSQKTVCFSEQIMSEDKYPRICLHQMEANLCFHPRIQYFIFLLMCFQFKITTLMVLSTGSFYLIKHYCSFVAQLIASLPLGVQGEKWRKKKQGRSEHGNTRKCSLLVPSLSPLYFALLFFCTLTQLTECLEEATFLKILFLQIMQFYLHDEHLHYLQH